MQTQRKQSVASRHCGSRIESLPLPQPYHHAWVFGYFQARAVAGIEEASADRYCRRLDGGAWVQVALADDALRVAIPAEAAHETADILERVRRVFDLASDATAIDAHLAAVPRLKPLLHTAPGIRVPGVWDAFEGAVRAVLGQQVSVARATTLAHVLCQRFGDGAFPGPAALAEAEVAAIGIPGVRGRAISELARRVLRDGEDWLLDADALRSAFVDIRGLGPWTAEYAAMRVSRDADAFPDTDWGVHKALGVKGAEARRWAEPCRPWRAYATMLLWHSRTDEPA